MIRDSCLIVHEKLVEAERHCDGIESGHLADNIAELDDPMFAVAPRADKNDTAGSQEKFADTAVEVAAAGTGIVALASRMWNQAG